MLRRVTLIIALTLCTPQVMATDNDFTNPEALAEPDVNIVVSYKQDQVRVLYNEPLPETNNTTPDKPTKEIVKIRLEDYSKLFKQTHGDPSVPDYFVDFPLHKLPKDVIKLIGRLSENVPGMSGINRFFRAFGYGVVLSLPNGFTQNKLWIAIKEGKNPYHHALNIEELHLTQLSQQDLIELGFVAKKDKTNNPQDNPWWGPHLNYGWEPHDHLLEKPKEIPCLLLTQTFTKLKRVVLRSNYTLNKQVIELMKTKGIKTRKVVLEGSVESLFKEHFFTVQEMRHLETIRGSAHGTEMVSQLLSTMLKGSRTIEDKLRVLATVSWKLTQSGFLLDWMAKDQVRTLLPILQKILNEPEKLVILDALSQDGLFAWQNLLPTQIYKPVKNDFSQAHGDVDELFSKSLHMDTMRIVALLRAFVTDRIYNQKYKYNKLILIFISALSDFKRKEQLRLIQKLLPLISTKKLNTTAPKDNKPYAVDYLNKTSIHRGLSVCKVIFLNFSDDIFTGFLGHLGTLSSSQKELLDPLLPDSDTALASIFWNYQKRIRKVTSSK